MRRKRFHLELRELCGMHVERPRSENNQEYGPCGQAEQGENPGSVVSR